ncbi:Thiamin-phosphate pyrophosphorylase [Candidatus Syntrophocurvum alkaliphilum]|uniref:Thiamine-phosphate synthase n=1 Tax=Candidatus Syntrophocurvum alkaliphilum TaxID=2293317 RepID=A0A6I6DCS2_9FIRM|nr:thiamine phosphate synthase [Candidatus Syntrophocurvum alkaliphilum]QGT98682.1 Thiamin-phosphate pyrophosphorylase [Candidatus Syntrophocurvum alkaliphilum]
MGLDYSIYLVTDSDLIKGNDIITAVLQAVKGGASLVQLREKDASSREFYNIATELKRHLSDLQVPLIINDRLDIALAVDADGLHIGQDDLPLTVARKILGENKVIGLSANTIEQAIEGEKQGATYLGVGPVYYTDTKKDTKEVIGPESLSKFKTAVNIPVVGIGGINHDNISAVKKSGIDGVAVVSAILAQDDINIAAQRMKQLWIES